MKPSYLASGRLLFMKLTKYHSLIYALARRELTVRYKGSILGFLWTFLNPVIQLTVYTIVFGSLFKNPTEHYTFYLFSGVLLWGVLVSSIIDGAGAMAANATLITKSALPPEIIPARVVLTHFLNYLLALPLFFAYAVVLGPGPDLAWLQLLFFLPLVALFCFSLALGLSVLGAIFRDVQYLISSITFALFFTVPVMYRFESLPPNVQNVLKYSPLTAILKMNADILYYRRPASGAGLLFIVGSTALIFGLSLALLRTYRARIAERL